MFSIVIPCFNKQNQILTTLNSILNQSFSDYEIIVVDDGSKDGSVTEIQKLNDPRIKLIEQKNAGVSIARNNGIKHANRKWIAFLDADDWWHPEYLMRIKETINNNPKANVICTNYEKLMDALNWCPKIMQTNAKPQIEKILNIPKNWLLGKSFFTSSIVVKKSFLNKFPIHFMPNESYGEDLDLWFRLGEQTPFYYIASPLVVYRTGQVDNLAKQHSWKLIPAYIERLKLRALTEISNKDLKQSSLLFVAHFHLTQARKAIGSGERSQALLFVWKAKSACFSKRWWFTIIMILFMPKHFIQSWQNKRSKIKEAN